MPYDAEDTHSVTSLPSSIESEVTESTVKLLNRDRHPSMPPSTGHDQESLEPATSYGEPVRQPKNYTDTSTRRWPAIVLALILIVVGVVIYTSSEPEPPKDINDVNFKPTDIAIPEDASQMVKDLDFTVNPCSNFLNYACRGWTSRNQHGYYRNQQLTYQERIFSEIATTISSPGFDTVGKFEHVTELYQQCLDHSSQLGSERPSNNSGGSSSSHFKWIESKGGWPLVKGINRDALFYDDDKIVEAIESHFRDLTDLDSNSIAKLDLKLSPKTELVITVDQLDFVLGAKEYYLAHMENDENTKLQRAFTKYVTTIATLYCDEYYASTGVNQTCGSDDPEIVSFLNSEAKKIYEIENYFANLTVGVGERASGDTVPTIVASKFQKQNSNFLKNALLAIVLQATGADNLDQFRIHDLSNGFFDKIGKYDLNPPFTPNQFKNYLVFRSLHSKLSSLPEQYARDFKAIETLLFKDPEQPSLLGKFSRLFSLKTNDAAKRACVEVISEYYPNDLSRIYNKIAYSGKQAAQVKKMAGNIVSSFIVLVDQGSAASELKEAVVDRLRSLKLRPTYYYPKSGYGTEGAADYFELLTQLSRERAAVKFAGPFKVIDEPSADSEQSLADAVRHSDLAGSFQPVVAYDRYTNSLSISTALMQDIYFNGSAKDTVNYGALGTRIAAELSTMLESDNLEYLAAQSEKFTETDFERFRTEIQNCYTEKRNGQLPYGNYKVSTISKEHIATTVAYHAYVEYPMTRTVCGKTAFLSSEEEFFAAYGQLLCERQSEKMQIWREMSGVAGQKSSQLVAESLTNNRVFMDAHSCDQRGGNEFVANAYQTQCEAF